MWKDQIRRDIPKIQSRGDCGLEHSGKRGGMNDQILVSEVMPTALANGLAMAIRERDEAKMTEIGLSNWINGVAVHQAGQDHGSGGLEHRAEVPLASVESKSRMKNKSVL